MFQYFLSKFIITELSITNRKREISQIGIMINQRSYRVVHHSKEGRKKALFRRGHDVIQLIDSIIKC